MLGELNFRLMHPFDKKMLIILFAIIFCFAINYFLPTIENKILDMIHRSVIVTVVYLLLIYRYKVLEEFHHLLPWKRKK